MPLPDGVFFRALDSAVVTGDGDLIVRARLTDGQMCEWRFPERELVQRAQVVCEDPDTVPDRVLH